MYNNCIFLEIIPTSGSFGLIGSHIFKIFNTHLAKEILQIELSRRAKIVDVQIYHAYIHGFLPIQISVTPSLQYYWIKKPVFTNAL